MNLDQNHVFKLFNYQHLFKFILKVDIRGKKLFYYNKYSLVPKYTAIPCLSKLYLDLELDIF